jgi:hypothetical protein
MIYLREPGNRRAWRLDDDQHIAIEEEVMDRIKLRVDSYITPKFRRMAYVTVCKLVGIHHPKNGIFASTPEIVEWRKIMLEDQTLDKSSYDAVRVWSMMLDDAARFSRERTELINAACMRKPVIVSDTTAAPSARVKQQGRQQSAALRRVV